MDCHKVPLFVRAQINQYMRLFEDNATVQQSYLDFLEYLNPHLEYNVIKQLHLELLKQYWIFEKSENNEVLFIASKMKAEIAVPDEVIFH